MTKWIIAVGLVLALVGVLLWQLMSGTTKPKASGETDKAKAAVRIDADVRRRTYDAAVAETDNGPDNGGEVVKLDPQGSVFMESMDIHIPNRFRAVQSKCYGGDGDGNRKIKLLYTVRVYDGRVTATNVRVKESNLNDPALEKCMIEAVQNGDFDMKNMPDHEEEGELFTRLRSLVKYKSAEEQVEQKARNRIDPNVDESEPSDGGPESP